MAAGLSITDIIVFYILLMGLVHINFCKVVINNLK